MTELFLIEVLCDETGDWLELEVSRNPYPTPGSEAEQLCQAGARYRWTLRRGRGR
jgi:hypothetical protein